MTAASATKGQVRRTASSSAGGTWNPEYLQPHNQHRVSPRIGWNSLDELLSPVDDGVVSTVRPDADISSHQPPILVDRLLRCLLVLVVPNHVVVTSDPQLSWLASLDVLAVGVDETGVDRGEELAAGSGDVVVQVGEEGDGGGLGHAYMKHVSKESERVRVRRTESLEDGGLALETLLKSSLEIGTEGSSSTHEES
jgi:hypothetical protein